jgi:transposase
LSATERLRVEHDLATLAHLEPQIDAVDAELQRLSTSEEWAEQVPFLVQLPGIGLLTAMTILGAIGDVTRFPSACALWSGTPVWGLGCTRVAKPTATRASPNRGGAICAL